MNMTSDMVLTRLLAAIHNVTKTKVKLDQAWENASDGFRADLAHHRDAHAAALVEYDSALAETDTLMSGHSE